MNLLSKQFIALALGLLFPPVICTKGERRDEDSNDSLLRNHARFLKKTKKASYGGSKKNKLKYSGYVGNGGWGNYGGWTGNAELPGSDDASGNSNIFVAKNLIESEPCTPWQDTEKYISSAYPSDPECRVGMGQMKGTGDCCRIYKFSDNSGPQGWLYYDPENTYSYLGCVCNQNTAVEDPGNMDGLLDPDEDPDDNMYGFLDPDEDPVTSNSVCKQENLTPVQKKLQGHMQGCENSSECPSNRCCYASYCICWPIDKLAGGLAGGNCV